MTDLRLLVASSLWPHPAHSVRAANVVIFEMIAALAQQPGVHVGLLVVEKGTAKATSVEEQAGIAELRGLRVEILPGVICADPGVRRGRLARLVRPRLADELSIADENPALESAVRRFRPDTVIVPWSEWLTAAIGRIRVEKFAYYGNPDPKNRRAQLNLRRTTGEVGRAMGWYIDRRIDQFERLHIGAMKAYRWLGDVAANDAQYYVDHGHTNAFYIRNLWVEPRGAWQRTLPATSPSRIIANVGRLNGTANTYGLAYLGGELLPALRRVFGSRGFELHVLGAGEPPAHLSSLLAQEEIKLRGFVDDIDQEIVNADSFLCVNNATPYKVGHTRYLHAWSLGVCVVAHADAALSMPEMVHDQNTLLGNNADEIAAQLVRAHVDASLRERVAAAGRATFLSSFTAEKVVPEIVARIRSARN